MQADTQARYEVKFISTTPEPRYITCWWTQAERDKVIKSMIDLGWDVIRVTRLFEAGVREMTAA